MINTAASLSDLFPIGTLKTRQELLLWALEEDGTRTKRQLFAIELNEAVGDIQIMSPSVKAWYSHDLDTNNLVVPAACVKVVSLVLETLGARPLDLGA